MGIFSWSHWYFRMICKMKMVTGSHRRYCTFLFLNKVRWYIQVMQKVLQSVNKWLMYLFFAFQLYFQVSQHKHQDNIHSSVQWKERKTGGPGVPSEACATPDLSLDNKHSRQHGSPDQPPPFSHWNHQVLKPWVRGGGRLQTWDHFLIHFHYFAFAGEV